MQIVVPNATAALATALSIVSDPAFATPEETRNGPCLVLDEPLMTVTELPTQRVILSPTRNANPFFHLSEALWMLAGRNDVEFPALFVKRMREYSDDGNTLNGAYGYRWRRYWSHDQLNLACQELTERPGSRRAVIGMWDPGTDMVSATMGVKDVPCNTHIYFRIVNDALDMTVCCRSNDIVWGAFGANTVHFSVLQEYIALKLGVAVGRLIQFSNNAHLYLNQYSSDQIEAIVSECVDEYSHSPTCLPLFESGSRAEAAAFMMDCEDFTSMDFSIAQFRTAYFHEVVVPMYQNWAGMAWTKEVLCPAWGPAGKAWIERRKK